MRTSDHLDAPHHDDAQSGEPVRISNWTLATGQTPGQRG